MALVRVKSPKPGIVQVVVSVVMVLALLPPGGSSTNCWANQETQNQERRERKSQPQTKITPNFF